MQTRCRGEGTVALENVLDTSGSFKRIDVLCVVLQNVAITGGWGIEETGCKNESKLAPTVLTRNN
jgi:hypothetical protein